MDRAKTLPALAPVYTLNPYTTGFFCKSHPIRSHLCDNTEFPVYPEHDRG